MNAKEESYDSVLRRLTSKTGFRFAYNPEVLPKKTLSLTLHNQPLHQVLGDMFGSGFEFKVRGSYIVIRKLLTEKPTELILKGQIIDRTTGKKLKDVSVYDADNLTATLTKPDGSYSLNAKNIQAYKMVAISKKNYRDTLVSFLGKESALANISLTPIPELSNDSIKEREKWRLLRSKKVRKHTENVYLQETRPIQLSLVPSLGTNGFLGGRIENNVSLNIVAGYAYQLNGVELAGVLNMERMDAKGFQAAGVSNIVGSRMVGVQLAGVSSSSLGKSSGFQASGVFNSSGDFEGVQTAGVWNQTSGTHRGVQISGVLNNVRNLRGVQLGVVNIAKKVEKGFQLGIVNISGNGLLLFEPSYSDLINYQFRFKSGMPYFYSILQVGINPHEKRLWSYGTGFGSMLDISAKSFISLEVVSSTIQSLDAYIDGTSIDNFFDLSYGYHFSKRLKLRVGPTLHYYLFDVEDLENQDFYERVISDPLNEDQSQKLWLGYHVGLSF